MNKIIKICWAVLGGVNTAFSIIIPFFIALLIINSYSLNDLNQMIILIAGYLSAIYRAASVWL